MWLTGRTAFRLMVVALSGASLVASASEPSLESRASQRVVHGEPQTRLLVLEHELRQQLIDWGFSDTFVSRFLAASATWDLGRVDLRLAILERADIDADARDAFLAMLGEYGRLVRKLSPDTMSVGGQRSHIPDAELIDAVAGGVPAGQSCLPYITGVTVSAHGAGAHAIATSYGAAGVPTAGPDFMVMATGDYLAPGDFFDVDFPPVGCDGDNFQVTFTIDNDIPAGGVIEVQSIRFDFNMISYEYPTYVNAGFNDYVFGYLNASPPIVVDPVLCTAPEVPVTGCLVTQDSLGNPTNIDSGFFELCSTNGPPGTAGACDLPSGTPGWDDVFIFEPGDLAGSTGLLTACTPLSPTCVAPATAGLHQLTLIVGDAGDGIFTTAGVFDNLRCFPTVDCTFGIPEGACCIGAACTIETSSGCDSAGGIYEGDDTTCAGVDCFACGVDGTACDDGDACTDPDTCLNDVCVGGGAVSCDDGDACTADSCDTVTGCASVAISCDDGNACTADSCDAVTGCANDAISCDDGNACTADSCDTVTGCANDGISCDDGNACTADSCDAATGCANDAIACDDGDLCTIDDCDPLTGCTVIPVLCDDSDGCTADLCDPLTGICLFPPLDPAPAGCSSSGGVSSR